MRTCRVPMHCLWGPSGWALRRICTSHSEQLLPRGLRQRGRQMMKPSKCPITHQRLSRKVRSSCRMQATCSGNPLFGSPSTLRAGKCEDLLLCAVHESVACERVFCISRPLSPRLGVLGQEIYSLIWCEVQGVTSRSDQLLHIKPNFRVKMKAHTHCFCHVLAGLGWCTSATSLGMSLVIRRVIPNRPVMDDQL